MAEHTKRTLEYSGNSEVIGLQIRETGERIAFIKPANYGTAQEGRRFDSCLLHSENNGPKRQSTETGRSTSILLMNRRNRCKVRKQQSRSTFLVTAYCPCEKCCGEWSDGITASSHKIQPGDRFVAAPPWIPFGTYLTLEGYAGGLPVPVWDRGSAIRGNKFDVFFGDHDEAEKWGVKEYEMIR